MAKITIVGDAMVVNSTKKLEDIKRLEKYEPSALMLFETNDEGKKEPVFAVGSTTGEGSIGCYGASFASTTRDGQGLASITLKIPTDVGDVKQYAVEKIGKAILLLNKVEEQIDEALAQVDSDMEVMLSNIEIV